jgi:hypothetical protein
LKKFDGPIKGLFEDAERLTPPPALWRAIEARSGLTAGGPDRKPGAQAARVDGGAEETDASGPGYWGGPWIRLAASVALAAGLLGLGVFFKDRIGQGNATTASAVQSSNDTVAMARAATSADTDTEIVDPELLGWHADLGEMVEEADEAEEIL